MCVCLRNPETEQEEEEEVEEEEEEEEEASKGCCCSQNARNGKTFSSLSLSGFLPASQQNKQRRRGEGVFLLQHIMNCRCEGGKREGEEE